MESLDGKVALVSGGARGPGSAIARLLAAEGARVMIADVHETEGKNVAKSLGSQGCFVFLDVMDPSEWTDAVERTENTFGRVNILVNFAGIVNCAPFDEYTNQQFGECIEGNLFGTFYGMKTVIPSMKIAGGGSIVNISSVSDSGEYPKHPGPVAAGWGLRGLTNSAALDPAQYHIRVNAVCPVWMMRPPAGPEEHVTAGSVAMDQSVNPNEIARVVLFLASEESVGITGAEIAADGGTFERTYTNHPEADIAPGKGSPPLK
jgi:3alpha(or 20beta)-hydroxysteroid dehydrogenase